MPIPIPTLPVIPAPSPITIIVLSILFYSLVNAYREWRNGGGKWW